MSAPPHNHPRAPGLWFMIAMVVALTVFSAWSALHRTAMVDRALSVDAGEGRNAWPDMRIDINSATIGELALLPGVGERLAQRIIDDRNSRGPFSTVDDVQRVPGMGMTTIERLRAYAVAEPVKAQR